MNFRILGGGWDIVAIGLGGIRRDVEDFVCSRKLSSRAQGRRESQNDVRTFSQPRRRANATRAGAGFSYTRDLASTRKLALSSIPPPNFLFLLI